MHYLLFALSGFSLAAASLFPETWLSLASAIFCAVSLRVALESESGRYRGSLLAGTCFHLLAFYWVPATVQTFGGFSFVGGGVVFLLFVLTASIQFVVLAVVFTITRGRWIRNCELALPFAWMLSEFFFPRLFPWQIGHSLIIFSSVAGAAEFVGVTFLSGLVVWWGSLLYAMGVHFYSRRSRTVPHSGDASAVANSSYRYLFPTIVTLAIVALGIWRNSETHLQITESPTLKVALVQGNLSTEIKGDATYMQANLERYQQLSSEAVDRGAEVVFWPESVVNQWLPESLDQVRETQFDPAPELLVPLVYGTLAFAPRDEATLKALQRSYAEYPELMQELRYEKYNAGVGVSAEGEVVGRYYKRILMPFGEFLPFAETFPMLRSISPHTGDFTSGRLDDPVVFPASASLKHEVRAGLLICYEDLIPSISAAMVSKDANLLVNLTNDAWYGDTAAPHQHHLLAQWRAIEARKYLLRVTNTGKTAVVDPFGRTQTTLPVFEEAVLLDSIQLLEGETVYSRHADILTLLVLVLISIFGVRRSVR